MQTVLRTKSFVRYFTDVDLADVRLDVTQNNVVGFKINYRAFISGAWHEVIRYDNAHGKPLHIHRFWPPTKGKKEFQGDEIRRDYTDAVEESLLDLEANWQTYRRKVEESLEQGGKAIGQGKNPKRN